MAAAGEYPSRVEWFRRNAAGRTLDGFGQKTDAFQSRGHLWAAVEDLDAPRSTETGSERPKLTATVRLRNFPGVAAADRLDDDGNGVTWRVLSVVRGVNETVCDVEAADD